MRQIWLFWLLLQLQYSLPSSSSCTEDRRTDYRNYNRYYSGSTRREINLTCSYISLKPGYQLNEYSDNNVKRITIVESQISVIPSGVFSKYTFLKEIYLNNSSVETMYPGAFAGLLNLEELHLEQNNITKLVPGVLSTLIRLKMLNMSRNSIEVVQEETFWGLLHLKSVDVSHNKLKRLPPKMFLEIPSLKLVDLSFNNLNNLPPELIKETNETLRLNFDHNTLTSVDFLAFPAHVAYVSLRGNLISAVNGWQHLRNISELDLSNNSIQNVTVPATLNSLKAGHNKVALIGKDTFRLSTDLEILDLGHNLIKDLHEDIFARLSALRRLDLGYNSLDSLAAGLFRDLSSLVHLSLSFNHISKLELGTFVGLNNLLDLDVSGNKLEVLIEDAFYELRSLRSLNISHNRITTLNPYDLHEHLPYLQVLDVADNPWRCKSLVAILKTFKSSTTSEATVLDGTAVKSRGLKGIACFNDSADDRGVPEHPWKEKVNNSSQDFQTTLDTNLKAYFLKYIQNLTSAQLQLNDTIRTFLEYFNDGFQNTIFYKYFSGNFSNVLKEEPTGLAKLVREFERFESALKNSSLNSLAEKLKEFFNGGFERSDFRDFFESGYKETDFFKAGFRPKVDFDFTQFDEDFKNTLFFKLFSGSATESSVLFNDVAQKFLKAVHKYEGNASESRSELSTDNTDSDIVQSINKLVTLNIILVILVITIAIVVPVVRRGFKNLFSKQKVSVIDESGSRIRILEADMELS